MKTETMRPALKGEPYVAPGGGGASGPPGRLRRGCGARRRRNAPQPGHRDLSPASARPRPLRLIHIGSRRRDRESAASVAVRPPPTRCASPAASCNGASAFLSPPSCRCGCAPSRARSTPCSWGTRSRPSPRPGRASPPCRCAWSATSSQLMPAASPRWPGGRSASRSSVPSTFRPHGAPLSLLDGMAAAAAASGARWCPDGPRRADAPVGHMRPDAGAFAVVPAARPLLEGARVLLLDDTYVSGARAQSAAAALRLARCRLGGRRHPRPRPAARPLGRARRLRADAPPRRAWRVLPVCSGRAPTE